MTYSEEEIEKYLNILESYKDLFHDTSEINEDYFKSHLKKCLVIIVTILILSIVMVIDIVINVFIQLAIFLAIMKYQKVIDVVFIKRVFIRDYHYQNKIEEINKKFDFKMSLMKNMNYC